MIVSGTGPIITFARLRRLSLLRQIFDLLIIPQAVYDELLQRGVDQPGALEAVQGEWIQTRAISNYAVVAQMPSPLHAGEREAIILAQEHNAQLLMDEQRGRAVARERGVVVIGSLRVLAEAKHMGLIPTVRPLIAELREIDFWIQDAVVREFLEGLGER